MKQVPERCFDWLELGYEKTARLRFPVSVLILRFLCLEMIVCERGGGGAQSLDIGCFDLPSAHTIFPFQLSSDQATDTLEATGVPL